MNVPSSTPPPAPRSEASGDVAAPLEDPSVPHWPAWSAPAALFAAFGVAIVGGLVVAIVAGLFGASLDHPPPAVNIAATVVQDAAFIGTAIFFAGRFGAVTPALFGLRRTAWRPAFGWATLAWLAFFIFSGVWAALLNLREKDQLPQDLGVHESTIALVAVCVLVTVIAPVAEELFFRGYFFGALRGWRGPWPAAVVTGLVFGAIHAGSAPVAFLMPLAVLGFLLCLLRLRTGSLLPCFAVHALNNAIAFSANEASWNAWQAILLILGANAVILLGCRPFLDRSQRPTPALA